MNRLRLGWAVAACLGSLWLVSETGAEPAARETWRLQRAITVRKAGPQRLEVDIEVLSGARPSLEDLRLVDASQPGEFSLHYGSEKAKAPHYDLEVERESVSIRQMSMAQWAAPGKPLSQSAVVATPGPPSEALLHGSSMEPEEFRYSRAIIASGGKMTSLRLDAAVLAHSADLSDIRILDSQKRQVPYLVERESEPLVVALDARPLSGDERPRTLDGRQSAYRVDLPFSRLPQGRLSLTTSHRIYRRDVSLYVEVTSRPGRPAELSPVAQAAWVHADSNQDAPALELAVPEGTAPKLLLVVEDGDNVALPITSCRLLLPGRSLRYFHAEEQALTLYYGDRELAAPSYDLALLTKELEGLPSLEASLAEERMRAAPPTNAERLGPWFWAVLVVTALSLLGLIARLVGKVSG